MALQESNHRVFQLRPEYAKGGRKPMGTYHGGLGVFTSLNILEAGNDIVDAAADAFCNGRISSDIRVCWEDGKGAFVKIRYELIADTRNIVKGDNGEHTIWSPATLSLTP
jgi:hypothetical protein